MRAGLTLRKSALLWFVLRLYRILSLIPQSKTFQTASTITPSPFASPNLGSSSTYTNAQKSSQASRLKARPVPPSTFNSTMFSSPASSSSSAFPSPAQSSQSTFTPLQPTSIFAPLQPTPRAPVPSTSTPMSNPMAGPNYNISLTPSAPSPRSPQISVMPPSQPRPPPPPQQQAQAQSRPPPGYSSGLMQPTVASKPGIPTVNGKVDWGDFDPLG
jgi:SCY1-like protein 2